MMSNGFGSGFAVMFSSPCAKPRPYASNALRSDRMSAATPKSPLDAKSSSTAGSSAHLEQGVVLLVAQEGSANAEKVLVCDAVQVEEQLGLHRGSGRNDLVHFLRGWHRR